MLVELHTLNALATVNGAPLILNPVESTRNLSVEPAANITVLHKPAVPTTEPMMVLQPPVTTAQPELHPKNRLLQAVVLESPAQRPAKKLWLPVVLQKPAQRPVKKLWLPVQLLRPAY
jgi:hypothetical protein